MRIKDFLGRSQSVSDSQTVMLRDDAGIKIKGKIARHSQTRSHTTTNTECFDSKRDEISQSGAVLQRMRRLSLLGKTETKLDHVLKQTSADIIERRLQTKDLLWLGEVHSPRRRLDSPARHSSEKAND